MPIVTSLKERIDELERVVAQQRRFAVRVKTQNAVSKILGTSVTVDEAVARTLEAISSGLSWELALFWSLDTSAEVMRCTHVYQQSADFDAFVESSRSYVFSRGMGVPGEVWVRKRALSASDVQESDNFPRLPLARGCGLHGVFAFPVMAGDVVLGVFEAYTREQVGIDDDMLAALSGLGLQIGQFLGRKQADRVVPLTDETYRLLVETAPDGVLLVEPAGRILFANAAAAVLLGYSPQELTRVSVTALMPRNLREQYTADLGRIGSIAVRDKKWPSVELVGLHKMGSEVPVEVSCAAFGAEGQTLITVFIRERTRTVTLGVAGASV
jgi:adenylate cyclase